MALKNTHFVDEALRLVDKGERQGLQLRILGSLAFRIHCPENILLFEEMERELTDIDFAAERRQGHKIRDFLVSEGYIANDSIMIATEGARHIYEHAETRLNVDVFTDELYFCHPIPFKGRLHLDSPTIPTTDLLLEKMQIVEINLKDIKDSLVLLLEHPVGDPSAGRENINLDYILNIMARDWGFYYTFTTNLKKLKEFMPEFASLKGEQRQVIAGRVDHLLGTIEAAPKSMGWRLRAKVGTRKKWYQEVSEKGEMF
ncbi:MAG TPA: hypothetical protein VJN41_08835 [Alphaproteobacteria bacterium]|nr:hypothetical protein [Alphaproteobacteria bacterium]